MNEKSGLSLKMKKKIGKFLMILKFVLLILIIAGIPLLIYLKNPEIIYHLRSLEDINRFLASYETVSIFIYIGMQIVQIVVAFLPGQALQFAAGYAFSIPVAFTSSLIGIALGTVATFYLGKLLGKDMIHLIFGKIRMQKFVSQLNSKRGVIIIALIYLFPGIPKDVFSYAAGLSEMRILPFLLISLVARTPALICSILVGYMFRTQSYMGMIIVSAIVLVIAVLAVIYRKKFTHLVDRLYQPKQS